MSGIVKGVGKLAGGLVKGLAPIASMIPGPIGMIGKAATLGLGALDSDKKGKKASGALDQQGKMLDAQRRYGNTLEKEKAPLRAAANKVLLSRVQAGPKAANDLSYLRDTANPFSRRFAPPPMAAAPAAPPVAGAAPPYLEIAKQMIAAGKPLNSTGQSMAAAMGRPVTPAPAKKKSWFQTAMEMKAKTKVPNINVARR